MESYLLNQEESDQKVIANLLNKIRELEGVHKMQLIKNNEGNIVRVSETVDVSREELVTDIEKAESRLAAAKETLKQFDSLAGQTESNNVESVPVPGPETQPEPQPVVEASSQSGVPEQLTPLDPTLQPQQPVANNDVTPPVPTIN